MISTVFEVCIEQLQRVCREESSHIQTAAEWVADTIEAGKDFFTFGSGHSAFIARDATWRAGGLAPAMAISDPMFGDAERLPGFAAALLGHYELRDGGLIIIISNSGINHLPIELALECKQRNLRVIAMTSVQHSREVPSRHPSGLKLMDIADLVIDTHGVPGDATTPLPNSPIKVAPTSTMIGSAIMQAIAAQAAALLLERGVEPPVIVSSNLPEGDRWNAKLAERYRLKLARYEVSTVGSR